MVYVNLYLEKKTMKVQLNDIRKKSTWNGKEPPNHSVGFDYCRKLIKQGVNPKERLEIYRGEELAYSMILEEGAKWKIRENERTGPKLVKYVENAFYNGRAAASG